MALAVNYSQAALFGASPFQPLALAGDERPRGRVREFGNLSLAVVHDAGHFVAADQPDLALEVFRRAIGAVDVATGQRSAADAAVPFAPDSPIRP